jgi:hypothetical protein
MIDEAMDALDKQILVKKEHFLRLWGETSEINRVVFNDKMDQIQRSCKIEHRRRKLVKEGKDSKKALEKIRKQNGIFGWVFLLFLSFFEYFTFLQPEFYQSSSPQERAMVAMIIGGLLITIFLVRDLAAWIDLNSKKSKLDIIQLLPDNLHVEDGFYNFFVQDDDDEDDYDFDYKPNLRDELEHKKKKLEILKSKERLLMQINDRLKTSSLLYDRWSFNP